MLLINAHSLIYNQVDCFAIFLRHTLKLLSECSVLKPVSIHVFCLNSFLASGDFCRMVIIFTNSVDPDHYRQNVGADLDPNRLIH